MNNEIHTREDAREDSSDLVAAETAGSENSSSAATSETVIEIISIESRCCTGKDLDLAEVRENSSGATASDAVGNEKSSFSDSLEALDEIKCVESICSAEKDEDLVDIGGNSLNPVASERTMSEKSSIPVISETVTGKDLDLNKVGDNSSDQAASNAAGNENSSNSVCSETLYEIRCADRGCFGGKGNDLGGYIGNSSNSVASETVIDVRCTETECNASKNKVSKAKTDVLEGKKIAVDKMKSDVPDLLRGNCEGVLESGRWDGEKVCRICHLSSDRGLNASDMIQLGCDCKGELGTAHRHCAETWFKLKGNRWCEICGESAKNITGVGDSRFMEMWNNRMVTGIGSSSLSERGRYPRCQPFGNFLLACLVIAFILPWFFRVNMF
ncbi:hypothetical protein AAC387_Pa05g0131 [Persea americana]